jgi:hypothetical protein
MSHSDPKSEEPGDKPRLLIPSFLTPGALRGEEKRTTRERRLRIKRRVDVDEGSAKLNPEVMRELGITDKVEVVLVGGGSRERRYVFKALPNDSVPRGEVWCNEEELRRNGIADNSIATVRAAK